LESDSVKQIDWNRIGESKEMKAVANYINKHHNNNDLKAIRNTKLFYKTNQSFDANDAVSLINYMHQLQTRMISSKWNKRSIMKY
jgi:hypothetical protein